MIVFKRNIMEDKVYLHVPKLEDLNYRKKILNDINTMEYNKGYEMSFEGYDISTGCIDFPGSKWKNWYFNKVNNKPNSFYAYITRVKDNAFIGEVNIHWNQDKNWYDMGIVIEGKYRGRGYSVEALRKLLEVSFEDYEAPAVHNEFESTREAAIDTHKAAGFSIVNEENGIVELLINRRDYLDNYK